MRTEKISLLYYKTSIYKKSPVYFLRYSYVLIPRWIKTTRVYNFLSCIKLNKNIFVFTLITILLIAILFLTTKSFKKGIREIFNAKAKKLHNKEVQVNVLENSLIEENKSLKNLKAKLEGEIAQIQIQNLNYEIQKSTLIIKQQEVIERQETQLQDYEELIVQLQSIINTITERRESRQNNRRNNHRQNRNHPPPRPS